jgi:hypothetical protein
MQSGWHTPSPSCIHITKGYLLEAAIQSLFSISLPVYPNHKRISIGGCYSECILYFPSCIHITTGYLLEAAIQSLFSISLPVYPNHKRISIGGCYSECNLYIPSCIHITTGYLLEAAIQRLFSISLPVSTSHKDIYWRLLFRVYSPFPLYPHHTRISIGCCYSEFIPPSPYIHTTQGYQFDAAIQSLFSLPLISTLHKDINWRLLFRVYSPFPFLYPHHSRISIGGCYSEFIPPYHL